MALVLTSKNGRARRGPQPSLPAPNPKTEEGVREQAAAKRIPWSPPFRPKSEMGKASLVTCIPAETCQAFFSAIFF